VVRTQAVECADHTNTNDDADAETDCCPYPDLDAGVVSANYSMQKGLALAGHLSDELFVCGGILLPTERLLQECKEHGHDNARLESLPEHNKEDWAGAVSTIGQFGALLWPGPAYLGRKIR